MKIRKKRNSADEGYWKSFTDIMAGLLMVILLVMMLLLLYLTQMDKEKHEYDHEYDYTTPYEDDIDNDHNADHLYDTPPQDAGGGGGGGGGGQDDPGDSFNAGIDNDYGHDKAAVHVTVIDEETKKPIQKEGILFQLHTSKNSTGKIKVLNTYYPVKVQYKSFETTKDGTFYLPEKIAFGWYSFHNLKAPTGYSTADDVNFDVTESKDWNAPYEIKIPMSPSKSVIYIQNVDAESKKAVGGGTYDVIAEEDIVTLDGTVRYKAGAKVCEIKCDESGKGQSPKIYLGKYTVKQTSVANYYAVNSKALSVNLNYLDSKDKIYDFLCQKTRKVLTLVDEETQEPVEGAVYTVTGKGEVKTNKKGRISLTDLDKNTTYTVKLVSLPKPYRTQTAEMTFAVDAKGLIDGIEVSESALSAYIIRLSVSVQDQLFGNEVTSMTLRLYDKNDVIVEEWTATGEKELFEDLDPGSYTLEADGNKSTRQSIMLKDATGVQTLEIILWTTWDTAAIVGAAVAAALLIWFVIFLIRSRRKKKAE